MLLIIDSTKENGKTLSNMLYHMGIASLAVSAKDAFAEISPIYKAAVIFDPSGLADAYDFVNKIRLYFSNIPIFAVSGAEPDPSLEALFTKSYRAPINPTVLVSDIVSVQEKLGISRLGDYRLAGIDASCELGYVSIGGEAVPFTKTELMILRYLIASYPTPKKAERILRYAFRQGRLPELTGIRTHVSLMNRKYRELRGENLIASVPKRGYVILTPESVKALATV